MRLNVALARALAALDASTLSEDARRYLHYMEFLATPPEANEGSASGEAPLTERPLTPEPEGEAWMRLYWEVPPEQRPRLVQVARTAVHALHG